MQLLADFPINYSYYFLFFLAVLVLYFKFFLHWDDNLSTAIYHTFVALCYLTPILGALIADSWLGKFKWVYISEKAGDSNAFPGAFEGGINFLIQNWIKLLHISLINQSLTLIERSLFSFRHNVGSMYSSK